MKKKSNLMTKAWKQMSSRVGKHRAGDDEKAHIPHDVPKGHLVVYVGKEDKYKRFVIKITLLHDPIFRVLLDQSRDEAYDDFTSGDSKFCIPCDETLFLQVLRCASSRLSL